MFDTQLDATHVTLGALQQLVPETIVAGGSFSGWLPHPGTLPPNSRATALWSAQESAVEQCVRRLICHSGLPEEIQVGIGNGGERQWPPGFVGSITHKGTVVLGVIVKSSSIAMVGIDLETVDCADLDPIKNTIASEGLPPEIDPKLATLLAFSAKEAVFKAQYPLSRRRLNFAEVQLDWADQSGSDFRAEVRSPVPGLRVRCRRVDNWVLSAAISR